ncbi:MAG: SGNH/GDSL hydrolase family protein [Aquabacterium sp.]|uniref:SGNH/GDSL hydrolase family protein n=1 Tax=Aquabacterium sp. TaxID=1872578 RepID=UPI00271B1E1E|nr:SGNH/GDSL hydrolase family protein [Aquabacterium sp.]MDO9003269.1 SGNH/GDSL hydrolase family protein [Aquabacterium sp.]
MKLTISTLAAWMFPAASLIASTGALAQQLQLPPLALAITGQASSVVLTPATAYLVGASPLVWNTILGAFGPTVKPYSEGLRMLTIKQAIRLRPVPLAPTPPAEVFANSYTQAISFGDSMSDTGNLADSLEHHGGRAMPDAPSKRGRFSDGVVVIEAMTNALNIPLVNYAFAGARSGHNNLMPVYGMQQGMLKQIQDFLDNQPSPQTPVDGHALYVLWTGPDDYYADGNIFNKLTTYQIANHVNEGMTKLYKRGARHFFVPQMPDLSITPSAHDHNKTLSNYLVNAKARSAEFATVLTSTLKAFARKYPQARVHTFETYTYSQVRMAQAAAEGNNVTEPCYTPVFPGVPGPVCANPDKYLFWDTNHPTAAGSTVIGTDFAKALVNNPPLPSR